MSKPKSWSLEEQSERLVHLPESILVPRPPFPKNIMVELSNACNHACVFCANPKMTRRRRPIDKALMYTILAQAYTLGAREVGFYTTGEPFVHTGLVQFVAEAKRLGYTYTYISTNGALATPARSKAVIDAGLDSIKFSMNAGSRATYHAIHGKDDWDTVVANLTYISAYRSLVSHDVKLAISYIVTEQNRDEMASFHAQFSILVDDIIFHRVNAQEGYMPENAEFVSIEATRSSVKAPCYMVFNRAHITCEGYLTLCCVDYQNYLAVADLNKVGLQEAWESPLFAEMRYRHLRNKLEGTHCWNCIYHEQAAVKPLVPEYAVEFDFSAASKANLVKQQERFRSLKILQ